MKVNAANSWSHGSGANAKGGRGGPTVALTPAVIGTHN